MSARIPIVSSDCHIGLALPAHKEYLESRYHPQLDEYIARVSAMFEQRATQKSTVRKYSTPEKFERMRAFSDQVSRDNDPVPYLNFVLSGTDITEPEVRALLGENAARCDGLDLAHLQSLAEAVGPTIEEIMTPDPTAGDDPETVMWADKPSFLF
jgi:hypothetical protein